MKLEQKQWVDNKRGLVDRSIFADQEIYQMEQEQVFGRAWLFVGHESQVPKPNDFSANYMGEDPILVTRDAKGNVHTFLNMCRHRGNRICRADYGNAPSFMCTYHGWTFATDGKLVGVPGYKEAYFEELDRSQWGLVEARTETYKGIVMATWDREAPTFIDYLGDYAWYLDVWLDRSAHGTELLPGAHKFVMNCNWKFGADNFCGDAFHTLITHASPTMVRGGRQVDRGYNDDPNRVNVTVMGHSTINAWRGSEANTRIVQMHPAARAYYEKTLPEVERRLGRERSLMLTIGPSTIFPNFTVTNMIRLWHPRGPTATECWSWVLVDKDMPKELKDIQRNALMSSFGPSGLLEQDDGNNFIQCTMSGKTWRGKSVPLSQTMGLGHERKDEILPGSISARIGEGNQRGLYGRWQEFMQASSWKDIPIYPRTKTP